MLLFNTIIFIGKASCNVGLEPIIVFISVILNLIKTIIPIALILYGTMDFAKDVIGISTDDMDKWGLEFGRNFIKGQGMTKFVKRMICAILIYFIPTFVSILMSILGVEICGI